LVHAEARARAIAFLSLVDDGCAEMIVGCPGGHAIVDTRHPALWSANHLRVDAVEPPDAAALHAAAMSHFSGLGFEMITILRDPVARVLAAPLAALGYGPRHELLMLLGEQPIAVDPSTSVVEVKTEDLAASRIAAQVEAGRGAHVGCQLASRDALIGKLVAQRCFAAVPDGEIAARCQLYSLPGVSQIENVYTAPGYRRRGLARALLAHAAREARAAGADLVFLVTAAGDWPRAFYRRAGFLDAALLYRFLRASAALAPGP
jgi:ribosomal protein S18 acetylase RimI-like enzyme